MSTVNFSHLRALAIFSTVVETGSFAATARKLGSSRSRISEQISVLESDINIRLLQRSTRQLTITDEGKKVYEQARQLNSILKEVESINTPSKPKGRVSITMPHDVAHRFILPVLHDFQEKFPEIQLDLILDDKTINLISEQIDLAIRVGIPKDESIIARVLYDSPLKLFAAPSYIEKIGSIKTINDIKKCHYILFGHTNENRITHLYQSNKMVEIHPKTFYRSDSPFLIQEMVLKGLGIGSLFPNTVRNEIKRGELVQLLPSLKSESVIFSLIYPSRHQVPQRTRIVIDYLLENNIFQ